MYNLINWYIQRYPFPHRGWKYFRTLLKAFGLETKIFTKTIKTGLSFRVSPKDHIQKDIFWYGYYDKEVTATFLSFIEKDTVMLDIGANIGYFSLLAAQKATEGEIFSFEPVSATRDLLIENIRLNRLENIRALPWCVSNASGERKIYISSADNIGMSGLAPAENFSGLTEQVESIAIDPWAATNGIEPTLIKIDVEGAEMEVLEGMQAILAKCKPVIFIEIIAGQLASFGSSPDEIQKFFTALDYAAYEITGENSLKKLTHLKDSYNIVFLPRDKQLNHQDLLMK